MRLRRLWDLLDGLIASGYAPLVGWILGALVALWIMRREWRGPRRGDEVRCRKCDYIVTAITTNTCPECGSTLNADTTVRGTLTPTAPRRIAAALLLVVVLSAGTFDSMQRYAGFKWRKHLSYSMLLSAADHGDTASIDVLSGHVYTRRLTADQVSELVDRSLNVLRSYDSLPEHPHWLRLLDGAIVTNALTLEQYAAMVQETVNLELVMRENFREGEPCVIYVALQSEPKKRVRLQFSGPGKKSPITITAARFTATVDNQPVGDFQSTILFDEKITIEDDRRSLNASRLPEIEEVPLSPGRHEFRVKLFLVITTPVGSCELGVPIEAVGRCAVNSKDMPDFVVAQHDDVQPHVRAGQRDSIQLSYRRGILQARVTLESFKFRTSRAQRPTCIVNAFLSTPGEEILLGPYTARFEKPNIYHYTVTLAEEPAETMTIVVRSDDQASRDAVRRTLNTYHYSYLFFEIKNVPVVWESPKMRSEYRKSRGLSSLPE